MDKSAELLKENPRVSVQEKSTKLTMALTDHAPIGNLHKPCAIDRSISFMEISDLYGVSNLLKSPVVRRISLKTVLYPLPDPGGVGCLSYIFLIRL